MNKKTLSSNLSFIPDRPTSKGASAYHEAVINTSWHKDNIHELIKILKRKIKNGDVLVDFGAGTGASSIFLLKDLPGSLKLFLVDNSASWLTKAYEILHSRKGVDFFLLKKKNDSYETLDHMLGKNTVDHIVSANTIHLISQIQETFNGIYSSLKNRGSFTFQSGNILRPGREKGILMIDDSVEYIHDAALKLIRTELAFKKYRKNLTTRVKEERSQRMLIFPAPRSIELYLKILKSVGFKNPRVTHKRIKVKYTDWLNFLRVKRLQAGILPEIGGRQASPQEEEDRDLLITKASKEVFKNLKTKNPFANSTSFTAEWMYVYVEK